MESVAHSAKSMVERFLKPRGITDARVLKAMMKVERFYFVPEALRERAYSDHPLPIGDDQTISQPYIVAVMTQALELSGGEKVLEIGTGSGYQTAVLAELAKSIFSIERHHRLAIASRSLLEKLEYHNISIKAGNGALGWEEFAPYDRIIVTASAAAIPTRLFSQLAEGGILVLPIGTIDRVQELFAVKKVKGQPQRRFICHCSFVPFVE
jgi:protein-L-isoaspartate(D-aspartate) O-methyltransferase